MRPFFVGAAFVLMAALTPVAAQHGGGHVSGGGHGGFGGHSGFSGRSGGGFSGAHSASAAQSGARGFSHSSGFNSSRSSSQLSARSSNRFRGARARGYAFRNNCYGYGCGYGYPYYPYLGGGVNPYWWWNSGSPDDQGQDESGDADSTSAQNYQAQPGDQDAYARSPLPRREEPHAELLPATVLVFRDQHKQEVQNYAIVGGTLWSFAPQHTQKIPLSDLDLAETTKTNDERGVDFRVPAAGQGQ